MKLFSTQWLKTKAKRVIPVIAIFNALMPKIALAGAVGSSSDMISVNQLRALQEAISGPILSSIAVIMVVVTSLMLAFGEWGDGFKRLIQIVFWISIAAGASSMITNMMGTQG